MSAANRASLSRPAPFTFAALANKPVAASPADLLLSNPRLRMVRGGSKSLAGP
jgi:hypothetical protein